MCFSKGFLLSFFMKVATSNKVILMLSFNFYSRRPLSHHQAAQVSIQLHTVVLTNTTKKKTMQFIKISVFFLRVWLVSIFLRMFCCVSIFEQCSVCFHLCNERHHTHKSNHLLYWAEFRHCMLEPDWMTMQCVCIWETVYVVLYLHHKEAVRHRFLFFLYNLPFLSEFLRTLNPVIWSVWGHL